MTRKERKERQRQAALAKKEGKLPGRAPASAGETGKQTRSAPRTNALTIEGGFWRRNFFAAIILAALPFIFYAATLQYGYILDDKIVLSENDFVQEGISGIADIFSKETFTGYLGEQQDLVAGGRYRPLSLAVFAFELELFGDKPGVFHLFNILWYALLGLLIFRVMDILFPSGDRKWFLSISFLTALLYLAHPIHTEAVANIKGRDEIMTFTLALGALYLSLRYIARPNWLYLLGSGVVFFLALLAKENAVTFIAVIPLTIYCFTKASWKDNAKTVIPLLLATAAYISVRYQVIGYLLDSGKEVTGLMNNPFRDMTGGEKYATIFYTLWRYIQLMFFPHPLTHDYYPYHIPKINWSDFRAIGPLVLYTLMSVFALLQLRKRRHVPAYAILFFIITISITSNMVFSVGTFMNERFAFMPSLGFALLVAWWLAGWLPGKLKSAKASVAVPLVIAALLTIGYGWKTMTRVPDWKDPMSLNLSAVEVSKNSARINNFMGFEYYKLAGTTSDREQKRAYYDQAMYYFDRALRIHPTYPDALKGKAGTLGGYHQIDGDLQKLLDGFYQILAARYIPYIDEYLEYLNRRGPNPQMTNFYHHTGYTLFAVQKKDYNAALRYLLYGVQLEPSSALLHQDLCIVYYIAGRRQEAIQHGNRAPELDPSLTEARRYLDLARGIN